MSGIEGRLRGINVSSGTQGRVPMDPVRLAEIRAGKSNVGMGDILIFDFDGDPSKISKAENDRTDNVSVEVKTVRAGGVLGKKEARESITVFKVGKEGDEKTEKEGDAPFEGIRAERDEKLHLNLFHAECQGGGNMQCSFRQVRTTKDGTFTSDWIGASDGLGFRVGRQ